MFYGRKSIIGNVGSIVQNGLRYTAEGKPVFTFSLAESNNYRDPNSGEWVERDATWYNISLWDKQAEQLSWITKGMQLLIYFGRLQAKPFTKKDGSVVVNLEVKGVEAAFELAKHPNQGETQVVESSPDI